MNLVTFREKKDTKKAWNSQFNSHKWTSIPSHIVQNIFNMHHWGIVHDASYSWYGWVVDAENKNLRFGHVFLQQQKSDDERAPTTKSGCVTIFHVRGITWKCFYCIVLEVLLSLRWKFHQESLNKLGNADFRVIWVRGCVEIFVMFQITIFKFRCFLIHKITP